MDRDSSRSLPFHCPLPFFRWHPRVSVSSYSAKSDEAGPNYPLTAAVARTIVAHRETRISTLASRVPVSIIVPLYGNCDN